MVGLAHTAGYYFTFMGIIITFSVLMNVFPFTFATISKTKANVATSHHRLPCALLYLVLWLHYTAKCTIRLLGHIVLFSSMNTEARSTQQRRAIKSWNS
jgi:hypothetical protein